MWMVVINKSDGGRTIKASESFEETVKATFMTETGIEYSSREFPAGQEGILQPFEEQPFEGLDRLQKNLFNN